MTCIILQILDNRYIAQDYLFTKDVLTNTVVNSCFSEIFLKNVDLKNCKSLFEIG